MLALDILLVSIKLSRGTYSARATKCLTQKRVQKFITRQRVVGRSWREVLDRTSTDAQVADPKCLSRKPE